MDSSLRKLLSVWHRVLHFWHRLSQPWAKRRDERFAHLVLLEMRRQEFSVKEQAAVLSILEFEIIRGQRDTEALVELLRRRAEGRAQENLL